MGLLLIYGYREEKNCIGVIVVMCWVRIKLQQLLRQVEGLHREPRQAVYKCGISVLTRLFGCWAVVELNL